MSHPPIINRFKSFYANLSNQELASLDEIYSQDISFSDPIHRVDGLKQLHHYIADLCENLLTCQFVYLDELVVDGRAYIKWDMNYAHPKIGGGKLLTVRGVSQIEFDERGIFYHEDFYDVGAMLYEHVPVIGLAVRWLKQRLARVSA